MLKTSEQNCFRFLWWIESSEEQHLSEIEIFCNIINVFIITFDQFKASLLNKSINFYNPPPKKNIYIYWLQVSCCRKQKINKLSNNKNTLLETGLLLKMQSNSLPVGGAVRAGVLAVSTVTAVIAHERYFIRYNENAIKTILKTATLI